MKSLLLVLTSTYLASCLPPPHPAVVAVRRQEEQLPLHLRNPAQWNPHLQEILPLTSLLHKGESLVFERESDMVSRHEIYKILTHAGFVQRRPPPYQPPRPHNHQHHFKLNGGHQVNHQHASNFNPGFFPYLGNPELLQYL